ncbi:tetratricopeptide repeat protein [Sphingobacterium mizutaii]|uniref:tetratricopeptide repeat protein n=1 Tax=Sphingobacterium mizutaii TaxID=1010 RepID=UPI001624E402|nr:NB-ARC domain-containing protein [Sphingobacterium mizutaii]
MHNNYIEGIPAGIVSKVNDKSEILFWDDPKDFFFNSDFPDLSEIICFKDNFKLIFPTLPFGKKEFQEIMTTLYSLRCKIAHVKGFFTSIDLDKLLDNCNYLIKYIDTEGTLSDIIDKLNTNPESIAIKVPKDFNIDFFEINGILNNLPIPDFEYEGGFVGRDDDIKEISKYLVSSKFPVITITGAGGVGKTSLALKVIQDLTQKHGEKQFDLIVWLSAKEDKLSPFGIEDIEPTFKSYEELLDTIINVIGFEVDTDLEINNSIQKEELALKLLDLTDSPLIVVDNLETVSDERILNFIIDAPPKIKFLITSRKGMGQVERRYELRELKEKEAIFLFRQIAKDKQILSLTKLDDKIIKKYVNKVSNYPLAIKWVIGQVARGREINRIINSIDDATGDISKFCFEQIFSMLNNEAKTILFALCCLEEAPTSSLLRYVVEMESIKFDDAIEELILASLVIPEQYKNEQDEISSKYFILPLTKGFIRQELTKNIDLRQSIMRKISDVEKTVAASEQAKREYRFSLLNLGAVSEEEKISAIFVQSAFQKYQSGLYEQSVLNYKKAIEIAPKFSSAYRNWAVMESQEDHLFEADQLMQKASELNPDDPQIWLLWGNIKRKSGKIQDADDMYQKAFVLTPESIIILNAYGQTRARLGDYENALNLLTKALNEEGNTITKKHEIISRTSIAEALISWSEILLKERDLNGAEEKLLIALENAKKSISIDSNDNRSSGSLAKTLYKLSKFYFIKDNYEASINYASKCIDENLEGYKSIRYKIKCNVILAKIKFSNKQYEACKELLEPIAKNKGFDNIFRSYPEILHEINSLLGKTNFLGNIISGKISRVDLINEYILVNCDEDNQTYIGGKNDFNPEVTNLSNNLLGLMVKFLPIKINKFGKEKRIAKNITIIGV